MKMVKTVIRQTAFSILIAFLLYMFLPIRKVCIDSETTNTDTVFVENLTVVTDTEYIEIIKPKVIDTQQVINDYFSIKKNNTSFNNEEIEIGITDLLYKNAIKNRNLWYTIKPQKPTPIYTFESQLFTDKHKDLSIALGIGYQKNRTKFSIGYDPFNKGGFIGFSYQLFTNRTTRRKQRKLLKKPL